MKVIYYKGERVVGVRKINKRYLILQGSGLVKVDLDVFNDVMGIDDGGIDPFDEEDPQDQHLVDLMTQYIDSKIVSAERLDSVPVADKQPQGHPHAELMAQYAEDAKTNAEPWEMWEIGDTNGDWWGMTEGSGFVCRLKYRRKPKTKLIHGVEVPDISFAPPVGCRYYMPMVDVPELHDNRFNIGESIDEHCAHAGICYPDTEEGEQAAILHAKAMLGIK